MTIRMHQVDLGQVALAVREQERDQRMTRMRYPSELRLARQASKIEGTPDLFEFDGIASVTEHAYPIYGGPASGGWDEVIRTNAFTKTLAERADVAFLLNHRGHTLARTKSGTLQLSEVAQGLRSVARLDSRSTTVQEIAIAMERGDLDEMSFAFRVIRDKWLDEKGNEVPWWDLSAIRREIYEVSLSKGDVSVVNYGANDATFGVLRADTTVTEILTELRSNGVALPAQRNLVDLIELRSREPFGDATPPAPEPAVSNPPAPTGMSLREARLAAARAI